MKWRVHTIVWNIYDLSLTIVIGIFTYWGPGYFNRVRKSISKFEERLHKGR